MCSQRWDFMRLGSSLNSVTSKLNRGYGRRTVTKIARRDAAPVPSAQLAFSMSPHSRRRISATMGSTQCTAGVGNGPNFRCSAGFQPASSRQDGGATCKLGQYPGCHRVRSKSVGIENGTLPTAGVIRCREDAAGRIPTAKCRRAVLGPRAERHAKSCFPEVLFVARPCAFIHIVGSSFVFNIFFCSRIPFINCCFQ